LEDVEWRLELVTTVFLEYPSYRDFVSEAKGEGFLSLKWMSKREKS
jgi:hypothetical protein